MDVQHKAVYTLALKQSLSEGDGCGVGGLKQQFHTASDAAQARKSRDP